MSNLYETTQPDQLNALPPTEPPSPNSSIQSPVNNQSVDPEKHKDKTLQVLLVITVILLVIIGVLYFYLNVYLPKMRYSSPSVSSDPAAIVSKITPSEELKESPKNKVEIDNLLSDLKNTKKLEFTDSITTYVGKCKGVGTYKGVVLNNDSYSLSQSSFSDDTIQFCPENLKAAFNETYWVEGKIYYKQYPDKPFAVKKPDDGIVTGENPNNYLSLVLPDSKTIQILPTDTSEVGVFKLKGVNSRGVETTYTITVADSKLKQLIYKTTETTDPDFGTYKVEGVLEFTDPKSTITVPLL